MRERATTESRTVTICSVGDLMLCDSPLYASIGIRSLYPVIRDKIFANCIQLLKECDVTVGNFESIIYKPHNNSLKELQMCSNEVVLEDLRDAGFNVLNLANNHIMQHGSEALANTIQSCVKHKMHPLGISRIPILSATVNGIPIVMLSACIHIEWYEPNNIEYDNDINQLLTKVKTIRAKSDDTVIIVCLHWGDEFSTIPSNAQVSLAHTLVDEGANVILGHHPHVFQGIERYKGSVVVYSQGNLISDMVPLACRETGICVITIRAAEEGVTIDYRLVPLLYDNSEGTLVPSDGDWVADRQQRLQLVLDGEVSESEYWKQVYDSHGKCHKEFRAYFINNITKYKLRVLARMLFDYSMRKVKKLIGISSFGEKGSMNNEIHKVLKEGSWRNL